MKWLRKSCYLKNSFKIFQKKMCNSVNSISQDETRSRDVDALLLSIALLSTLASSVIVFNFPRSTATDRPLLTIIPILGRPAIHDLSAFPRLVFLTWNSSLHDQDPTFLTWPSHFILLFHMCKVGRSACLYRMWLLCFSTVS